MWNLKRGVIAIVAIVLASSGIFLLGKNSATLNPLSPTDTALDKYPLLARRILIDDPNDSFVNFSQLRADLRNYFKTNNLSGGLYFEYLPTGTSIRVDGDEQEVAASLMKLPAAMDLYKANELGRIDIDKEVELKEEWLDAKFGELYQKGAGHKITLREATKLMLEDSDNTALLAVANSITDLLSREESALSALDVDYTLNPDLTVSISARAYSSFLKCLYFSCFLTNDDSAELLNYLTNTKFKNRIAAGVSDKSVKIAHKIGVAGEDTQSDCGIVYLPKRNYILCVFVNGQDNATTDSHIANISKTTFDFVSKR